jgi:hypothetical protein
MATVVCETLLRRPKTLDKFFINNLSSVNGCDGTDKLIMKTKMKVLLCLMLPDCEREMLCLKVCTIRPFITLTTAA